MNKHITYIAAILFALAGTACIKQKEEFCPPPAGEAIIHIRAEKFLARPPYDESELEESFNTRIHGLSYYLYRDGTLIREGKLDAEAAATVAPEYALSLGDLPYGSYSVALAANAPDYMRNGSPGTPESMFLVYQKDGGNDDCFAVVLPFDVGPDGTESLYTVLHRLQGVTRFSFANIPADVTAIEVTLSNVGSRTSLAGGPDLPTTVTKRVEVSNLASRSEAHFAMGTFPTVPGNSSSWRLTLYGAGSDTPVYDKIAAEGLQIEANQLIELKTVFPTEENGDLRFSVDMDTEWDGSTEGGGTVIIN